jgi:hypothetical protein
VFKNEKILTKVPIGIGILRLPSQQHKKQFNKIAYEAKKIANYILKFQCSTY